jgi:hypothetical protein
MQTRSSIAAVLGVLATGTLTACKTSPDAVEVPTQAPNGSEASCRHELGRCGGHKPGDGACGAGPSAGEESKPVPQDVFTAIVIEPGKFAEINLEMARGAAVTAEFTSSGAPVAWNVHSHVGEQATIHAEGSSASDTVRFVAERDGAFSYLWQNKGTGPMTLDVKLRTEGSVKLHSTHPAK